VRRNCGARGETRGVTFERAIGALAARINSMNRNERDPTPASADQLATALGGLADWLESVRRHTLWHEANVHDARKKQHERLTNILVVVVAALLALGLVIAAQSGVYQRPTG